MRETPCPKDIIGDTKKPRKTLEVIVLTDVTNGQYIKDSHMICFGHIVDKNIAIDYDGWNIPGVTHWMYLPKNNGGR
jgi:hypothetical protein